MYVLKLHTASSLERKIDELQEWVNNHYPGHYQWRMKKDALTYYGIKLCTLRENKLTHINA